MTDAQTQAAIETAKRCPHRGMPAYYLLNAGNWIIRSLMEERKKELGVPEHYPISDAQRLDFELGLLNEETREKIAQLLLGEQG